MKKIVLLLLWGSIAVPVYAQEGHPVTPAVSKTAVGKLTSTDWQYDLRFLQQTVQKDYSFLFKKITAEAFDAEVEKLYKQIPSLQHHEVLAGIARIVSSFKYGHTDISWRESPVKYQVAPINFYHFSDGIYVEGAAREYAQVVGAKLLKVEGVPVNQVLEAVRPLVPAENEQYFKSNGPDYLIIPEALHAQKVIKQLKQSVTYTFEKDGKTFEQVIAARDAFRLPRRYGFVTPGTDWVSSRSQSEIPNYLKDLDKIYYFEYLPATKTVYVRHSQILDDPQEPIPAFYKKVFDFIDKNDVERLVLDVRLNGGGNNYKNKPIVTGIIENRKINLPGKLFVIIGRRTFSACQNLVNELSNYTNALFVGEPTSENINFYGDNRRVVLPRSGTPVFLSFAWWQDKPQWENADWLAPQLAVDMSFEEYRTNKDPALEACLNFSGKDVILDPLARLRDLFLAGKPDEVEKEAKKMIGDPKYRYINFESRINDAGYSMLNGKQAEASLFVFQLNTRLFPKSANAWDSMAEACWKLKQKDKAIEYYNKAIELDPHGATGENARRMLKQVQAEK
ncbi:MAG: tetratricopeptide repeat protein [Ferruginibacter sp.]|nr:tetratricopeptide repeat protein [Ferruginibacter sp.]